MQSLYRPAYHFIALLQAGERVAWSGGGDSTTPNRHKF